MSDITTALLVEHIPSQLLCPVDVVNQSIQYAVVRQQPWTVPMRLLCIMSLIENGINEKELVPLVRLLIPNRPGQYDFTVVTAMGVITDG